MHHLVPLKLQINFRLHSMLCAFERRTHSLSSFGTATNIIDQECGLDIRRLIKFELLIFLKRQDHRQCFSDKYSINELHHLVE